MGGNTVTRVDGNATDCAPDSALTTEEMQLFAGHLAADGFNRISGGRGESEPNDRARPYDGWRDREPRSLRRSSCRYCAPDQDWDGEMRRADPVRSSHKDRVDSFDGSIVIICRCFAGGGHLLAGDRRSDKWLNRFYLNGSKWF